MKKIFFMVLLSMALLLVACDSNVVSNEIINSSVNISVPELVGEREEVVVVEPVVVEKPVIIDDLALKVTLPDVLTVKLTDVDIVKSMFGDDEVHEIKMLLSATQYDKMVSGSLTFTPNCHEEVTMFVDINKNSIFQNTLTCGKEMILPFIKKDVSSGPTTITLKNNIEEFYEITNVAVTLNYADDTQEVLAAADHLFKPEKTILKSIDELDNILLSNYIERTFKLNEIELTNQLFVSLDASTTDDVLIVLLNNNPIFQGTPSDEDILLPAKYLFEGKNTLTFIAVQK